MLEHMVLFYGTQRETIRNTLKYTLGTASKATGKSKSTLSRDIKSGKISAARKDGAYEIDPAELHRVYPPLEQGTRSRNSPANDVEPKEKHDETPNLQAELAAAKAKLETIEEERERERRQLMAQLEDLRSDRDQWRQQATRLLTDQRPRPEPEQPAQQRGGFWRWLRGGNG